MKLERRRPDGCLSNLRLDEFLLAELTGDDERETRAHLETCDRCRDRLEALEADRAAFAPPPLEPPAAGSGPAATRGGWRGATRSRGTRTRLWAAAGGGLAAAAAVLVYLNLQPSGPPAAGPAPGTRTKGTAEHVGFYVKHDGVVRQGHDGEVVRPGDALRFTYTAADPTYLAILSLDGADNVSVYHPAGDRLQRSAPGSEVGLRHAIVLDQVLGTERIYAIFCDGPRHVSELRDAIEEAPGSPRLPEECSSQRITIEKRR